jgi:type I restriction enzyme, S subunit
MNTYSKYKPSNIEWIGEIPEHWTVKRLKRFAKICNGQDYKSVYDVNGDFPIFGSGGEFGRANSYLHTGPSVLLGRKGTIDKPQYVQSPFWTVDTAYFTDIYPTTNTRFFYYLCTTINFDLYKYGSAIPSMNQEVLNQIEFAAPPLDEQTTIATYLDHKTAQIDSIIANKQKLIALYEEEKQTIINQAVTKGLNPNAKTKFSGVEWLGQIPEHWEVKRLKWIINEKLKYGANESAELEDKDLPRYIRITDFGDNGLLRDETFKSLPYELAKDYLLEEGDILFARSGATIGKTFQFKNYNGIACFAGYLIKAKPNNKIILSDFLYSFTKSGVYESWKNSIFNQATIQNIGADKYAYLEIPIPFVEEQISIVTHIEQECTRLNTLIDKFKKQIELFQEYRNTLISEVVTGKVKVIESHYE